MIGDIFTDWEERYCINEDCEGDFEWKVKQDGRLDDMWRVASEASEELWEVAAVDPICPHCGQILLGVIEPVEERRSHLR